VNTRVLKLFEPLNAGYHQPITAQTHVREYLMGKEEIERFMGSIQFISSCSTSGLDFAAIVPKGNYVTVCVLGRISMRRLLTRF
jgi:hypothetical protein